MDFYLETPSFDPFQRNLISAEYYGMITAISRYGYEYGKRYGYVGETLVLETYYIDTDKNHRMYSYKDYMRIDAPIITMKHGLVYDLNKCLNYHRSLKVLKTLSESAYRAVKMHESVVKYFHPIKYMPIKLGDVRIQGFKQLKRKKRS